MGGGRGGGKQIYTLSRPIRSYIVKENHFGSEISEILSVQTDRQIDILLLSYKNNLKLDRKSPRKKNRWTYPYTKFSYRSQERFFYFFFGGGGLLLLNKTRLQKIIHEEGVRGRGAVQHLTVNYKDSIDTFCYSLTKY